MIEREQKLDSLARDVLRLSRNTLLVNLRFLDAALSRFELMPTYETFLATDGHYLLYNARHVLKRYKEEKEASVRDYLHIVLHCVFRHMYVHTLVDQACWDLASDIAVEVIITELDLRSAAAGRAQRQQTVISELRKNLKQLTAEKIYRYYLDKALSPEKLAQLRALFLADDHAPWYLPPEERAKKYGTGGNNQNQDGKDKKKDNSGSDGQEDDGQGTGGEVPDASRLSDALTEADWEDIAKRMQVDMETFSKQQGDKAGGLVQNLNVVNREKYDYTSFLRKFAVMGEVMKVDDDQFDYIFYTYGLELYDNMPLIEPLEYKEVKRIREFVIAIDTSGSVQGETVQRFVQKTYNILKSTESFFSKINLHIIQCDAAIQEDVKITNQEEFDRYLKTMRIHGLGGTDFRPVFRYVDKLIKRHEFSNLKGLVYFTDGYGYFPERMPAYQTAFVFLDDDYNNPNVPPWAIKLVLQKEDI